MSDEFDNTKAKKDTKWKAGGPSPNPHGRRGKPRSVGSAPSKALDQPISYVVDGRRKKATVREGTALKFAKLALEGDKGALKILLAWEKAARAEESTGIAAAYPFNEDDLKTIDAICARIRATTPKPSA